MTTPIPQSQRYIAPGVSRTYWLAGEDAVADINNPTRPELDAGINLSPEIAGKTGWEVTAERVATPHEGSNVTPRITGRVNPGDPQIAFYASRDTNDIRTILQRGDKGYIYLADGGDVSGQLARLFLVEVSSVTPTSNVQGTEGERILVDFAILRMPDTDFITIP